MMRPGYPVARQEWGHACAVFYKRRRVLGTVLASGTDRMGRETLIVAFTDGEVLEVAPFQLEEV